MLDTDYFDLIIVIVLLCPISNRIFKHFGKYLFLVFNSLYPPNFKTLRIFYFAD